jgi:hypothetical protein
MQMIQRLKKLPDTSEIKRITSKRFRMVIFSWTFKLEVGIAIHTNTLPAQLKAIQEHEQFFNRPGMVMEPRNRLETLLALATMYFQLKDHKKAARLTERLLRDEAAGMHQELNVLARVLQVLLHYEDGSFDVLDYLVSGLKRFVARQKETGRMAKQLVEFTGKLKNLHRKRNSKLFFEDQFKKFSVLKNDRFEKQHFDYFDVTTWLAKKVNR